MTSALLVDDEANLLSYLARKLEEIWPELEIAGTAQNGRQALALAAELDPDIVFLDIHMPGLSGLQVAEQLDEDIQIVFVTAHDEYAVQAFDAAAADYLLKPVDDTRLRQTVQRLRERESAFNRSALTGLLRELQNQAGKGGSPESGGRYLQWLRVGHDARTQLVPVSSVVYFQADHKYTSVFTATGEHVIRTSIKELSEKLDPEAFWQIHRGIIVQVAEIEEAQRDLRGRYTLRLKSRPEPLRSSQRFGHHFKQM